MAFPWPSFGSFQFHRSLGEVAIPDTDAGWQLQPTFQNERAIGAMTNVVTLMSYGSQERTFEILLTQDRLIQLQALVGTVGTFTDWPTAGRNPDVRQAVLMGALPQGGLVRVANCQDADKWRRRVQVTLLSQ